MDNWERLKERLREQISDCNKHRGASGNWGTSARLYGEVLREMNRIENGNENDFKPMNGLWKPVDFKWEDDEPEEKKEPLMEVPNTDLKLLTNRLLYGREMKNYTHHAGETTWSFPKGVKEKIKDDVKYDVYYDYHDSADPSDTSTHYSVVYIKEM